MIRLLVTILLVFGTVVAVAAYLGPEWSRFQSLRVETTNLQQISAELDDLAKDRDNLLNSINSISKEDLARLDSALPIGPFTSEFLVSLEHIASKQALALRRIDIETKTGTLRGGSRPQSAQPTPGGLLLETTDVRRDQVEKLPFNMTIAASSYEAIKRFLGDLEKNMRLIEVNEISFSIPETGGIFDFSMRAETYYQ